MKTKIRLTNMEVFRLANLLKDSTELPYNTWSALLRDASNAIGRDLNKSHIVSAGKCVGIDEAGLVKEKRGANFSAMVFAKLKEHEQRIEALERAVGSIDG